MQSIWTNIKTSWQKDKWATILFGFIALFTFHLPLYKISASPYLIALSIATLVVLFKSKFQILQQLFKSNINKLFIAYFLWAIISISYSENKNIAFVQIKNLLPLLLFPLVFQYFKPNKKQIFLLLKLFIFSGVVAFTISTIAQIYNIYTQQDYSFYYLKFIEIIWMHPTYLSMYLNFNIYAIYYLYKQKELSISWSFALGFLFVFFILLLSARMQIILLAISLLFIFIHIVSNSFKKKKLKYRYLFFLLIMLSIIIPFAQKNQHLNNRFKYIQNLQYNFSEPKNWNGANVRLAIWNCTWQEIQATKYLGTGIGDADESLFQRYQKNQFQFAYKLKYTVHNQFLQTFLSLGILGFIIYLLIFYTLWVKAIKKRNVLLFGLTFVLFCTGISESFLRMQSGIVFFAFFIPLILLLTEEKDKK